MERAEFGFAHVLFIRVNRCSSVVRKRAAIRRLSMTLPGFLQIQKDGVCLAVKVQPRAPKNEIGQPLGNELKIKVTAPPVDSAANDALLRFVAEKLDCS